MLNPSTVSICRQYIKKELNELQTHIYELQMLKSVLGKIPPKKRETYLEVDNRLKKLKARRLKLGNAIRDLKACQWNGNPGELPCGYITTAVSYSPAQR